MNMSVKIAGVEFKNPVMEASGTFGSGMEYSEFVDLSRLGAVVTKGVANVPWPGNPTPRIAEVYGGMINAIGLQNPGYDLFASRDIPFLRQYDTKIIVNVCGKTTEDYVDVVEKLASQPVDMLEINISCPNVKEGGIAFGQDPKAVEAITKAVKAHAKQPVVMKLSPNVTDITVMAKAADINPVIGCEIHSFFPIPWKTYLQSASPYHPVPDDSSISRHEVPGLLCTKRYPKNGSSSVPNGCTTHDTHPNQTNHARATDAETSARPPHSSKPRRNYGSLRCGRRRLRPSRSGPRDHRGRA